VFLPPDVPLPKGPYTPAVRAGDFVYVSGQVPRDFKTGVLLGEDIATQTRAVLSNLQSVLQQAGASISDVVSVTVYLQDASDWGAMNTVYSQVFTKPYPTRTTVGADLRDVLVEISAVAFIKPASR
jgi:2-iminobutanoate/2-iminopropanoate deaminase